MNKTLIIYESDYGTTEKVSIDLSRILGPANYCKTEEFDGNHDEYDFIILGSPIYSGQVHSNILDFVKKNIEWLRQKKIALFCTCLSIEDGEKGLQSLNDLLGNVLKYRVLGGALKLEKLTEHDLNNLKKFSEMVGYELNDVDHYSLEKVSEYGLELKNLRDGFIEKIPEAELKKEIGEFLHNHNTCTLSTCHKNRVRSTPIEYNYYNGIIYLISEGGEKFANLSLNQNISLSVYEDFKGMNKLAGMQITGRAYIISSNEIEYDNILKMKNLNIEYIKKLPYVLNIIKIKIEKIEFLYSQFKEKGFDARQILEFNR